MPHSFQPAALLAEPVAVRHMEGTVHGFLVLRTAEGKALAAGDLIQVALGELTGVVAPLIGKQPEDIHVWILGGQAPAFIRMEGQFYQGGPVWAIELTSPVDYIPTNESGLWC